RDRLPAPRQQAIDVVFGLSDGESPNRFLVGLAALNLLATAAAERPLLWLVDDAQWLDRVSALTLAFIAHRLAGQPVGIVVAARERVDALRHLPELEVRGVPTTDARALLDSTVPL